jgi:hypothetical protein
MAAKFIKRETGLETRQKEDYVQTAH